MTADKQGAQVTACCATAYGSDLVSLLLGDSYHPGGLSLTRHLATGLQLQPGDRVLDLATGRGTTALLLAEQYGVRVDGVDLSAANIALAQGAADAAGLTAQVAFVHGDAEQLLYPDSTFDAAVCECALCLFPGKHIAVAEIARVLRPGGKLGLTDITTDPDRLPPELVTLTARVACIADARPLDGYTSLLNQAGLSITRTEPHHHAVTRMIDQIGARLDLLAMTGPGRAATLGLDLAQVPVMLAAARAAVTDGSLGYSLILATRPLAVTPDV